ncbi:MAG: hydrogenase small subunit [Firmicutes bacterium]|nr:hydrogenase small subunit [Bacillota bacterium]
MKQFSSFDRPGGRSGDPVKGPPPRPGASVTPFRPPLIWLGCNTCAGDLLSFLDARDPGYQSFITDLFDFRYNYLLMAAEGDLATKVLDGIAADFPGEYFLVVEGTVPTRSNGLYSVIGRRNGRPLTALQAVRELGPRARYVIAAGTCAAFGGPYAAAPNPSGSLPVQAVLDRRVINVPGCPVNPGWMMGTLVHLLRYGEPELDAFNRPRLFYGETIHNLCQRRHYFDSGKFAEKPGEPWCMYRIGCKGPVTYADCPYRQWCGEHVSWPVKANTPCIGCTSPEFPDGVSPFFEHLPDVRLPGIRVTADRVGAAAGAVTALGIGAHLAGNILSGRLGHVFKKGFGGGGVKKIAAFARNLTGRRR